MDRSVNADATAADPGSVGGSARILDWGLCGAVILAPLPFGSVVPWARGTFELLCALLAAVWAVRVWRYPQGRPGRGVAISIAGLLVLAIVQIVPLPHSWSAALQPATAELRTRVDRPAEVASLEDELLGQQAQAGRPRSTLSLDPVSTASSLRTGIALAALLLAAIVVSTTRGPKNLLIALAVSAGFQGLYGLLVVASGHDKIWNVAKEYSLGSATGTWVNPSHYSGYLAAALPVLLAWLLLRHRDGNLVAHRHAPGKLARTGILGLAFVLGLAGMMTSFSRAGIVLALLALGLVAFQAFRRRKPALGIGLLLLLTIAAAIPLVQLDPDRLVDKYSRSAEELLEGNRRIVWADTLEMFADSPAIGSGFGTFASVYPLYRSPEVRLLYRHTHNDPLQFLAESGLIGLALLLPLALLLALRLLRALGGRAGIVAGGIAAGLATTLLHACVDFPFHLPANAALAAILAGFLLGSRWQSES